MKRVFIATGITAVAGGLVTAALVSSCDTECTLEARPSAVVQFVDTSTDSSAPIFVGADSVTFSVKDDTGKEKRIDAECLDEDCTEWALGYEKPGLYKVKAQVCGKQYHAKFEVGMTEDGCHVETVWEKIEVDSTRCPDPGVAEMDTPDDFKPQEPCTLEARYSVVVDVLGEVNGEMQPIGTDSRYFKWSGDPDQRKWPGNCLNPDCSTFAVGLEQEGRFEIGAEVCGRVVSQTVPVDETKDGCHVDTQHIRLEADLSNCEYDPDPIKPPVDTQCSREVRPSAILMTVTDGGDVWLPYPTQNMVYELNEERHKAFCADEGEDGKCTRWITGWERDGRFEARVETCDVETSISYMVEKTDDGCHADTVYLPVFMDTRGCIQAPQPEGVAPVPVYQSTVKAPPPAEPPPIK